MKNNSVQVQESKQEMDFSSIMKSMGYETCFIKEVMVPMEIEMEDKEGYGEYVDFGYQLYEKIIVLDSSIYIMGFAEKGDKEVQAEVDALVKVLIKDSGCGIVNIFWAKEFPSHEYKFKNKEIEGEFFSPY